VRWKITSSDPNCYEAMDEFAREATKEYQKEIKKLRYWPIRKFLPALEFFTIKVDDGVILVLPLKLPDFKSLRSLVAKFTGKELGKPKWQERTTENLRGYLLKKGINFESVEYIGD